MQKLTPTKAAYVMAAFVGGVLTLVAFTVDTGRATEALDLAILPGAIAFLLVSGGEAGSNSVAEAIAPYAAGIVNMICYPILLLIILRIYRRLTNSTHDEKEHQ
jgi:hypothetical protein